MPSAVSCTRRARRQRSIVPGICAVYEVAETAEGQLFIAMPLYHGETLQARLLRGPLPGGDAVPLVLLMAAALQHAHAHGIVHRDVKPSNVMLLPEGGVKSSTSAWPRSRMSRSPMAASCPVRRRT